MKRFNMVNAILNHYEYHPLRVVEVYIGCCVYLLNYTSIVTTLCIIVVIMLFHTYKKYHYTIVLNYIISKQLVCVLLIVIIKGYLY